jgi:hypothetical protein
MSGDVAEVQIGGEALKLPVTMGALKALSIMRVCPIYLSSLAAARGEPFVLSLDQILEILVIGLKAAGVAGADKDKLWQEARRQELGTAHLRDAALAYCERVLVAMPEPSKLPTQEGGGEVPKA